MGSFKNSKSSSTSTIYFVYRTTKIRHATRYNFAHANTHTRRSTLAKDTNTSPTYTCPPRGLTLHSVNSTIDRSITSNLKVWVLTKFSISLLRCLSNFYENTKRARSAIVGRWTIIAPASKLFSMSSFTALAGRCTTWKGIIQNSSA